MSGLPADCPPPAPDGDAAARPAWGTGLAFLCRYVLAVVFLMAAVTKITAYQQFSDRVVLHSGLPYTLAMAVALVLPWLELTCGVCLVFGVAVREAALILGLLLVVFLVAGLLQPEETDCGCLLFPGALKQANQRPWLPLRNGILLLCSLPVVWWR